MIRILEEITEHLQSREHLKVKIALIRANRALFDEEAYKSGLMELRKTYPNVPSKKAMADATNIINAISLKIEDLGGKKYKWQGETMDAITFAKSSLLNIYVKNEMSQAIEHEPS